MTDTASKQVTVHHLKTHKPYFSAVKSREKRYELRKDDRGAEPGHYFVLHEYDPETKTVTGQSIILLVSGKLKDVPKFGLKEGYAIFDLRFHEEMTDEQKTGVQTILNQML